MLPQGENNKSISTLKDINIENILERKLIKTDLSDIGDYIKNEVVLVTGGGGSIGSEICRQVSKLNPKELIILDIYENNAYEIQQELLRRYKGDLNLKTIIASIRDKKRMEMIFEKYKPKIIFHAAAHKHVPLMESDPSEAIKNNIFGTLNVVTLAHKYGANNFVLISTDKAVNPTSIMGASKRVAEMIVQSIGENSETKFACVRFGNVLGSNGSVIPLFKKQISEGGPITITHPEMVRYFMTISEAVGLVINAGAISNGGEVFVLDMGVPIKILDLAKKIIKINGFTPEKDIKIKIIGLRPGEKLYEEILMQEEVVEKTKNNKIFISKAVKFDKSKLDLNLKKLEEIIDSENDDMISIIKDIVPNYMKEDMDEKSAVNN
ncbi:UDP-N-acetylglucosamine 4,6-dehydratase family protein [Faecalimicrobium dakarense]|uniref:UDP-N-acetylglucosamine 4,6-dehydratase family protein n=1 Tax=Faecalimicrobium dakarense TaxID=1301100 RepID=UPI0004BBF949|nr:nucleoside-diphosphate sugar epimerase/dehydratase [[Clostridium] dakarense]